MDGGGLEIVLFAMAMAGVYLLTRFARGISDQANSAARFEFPEPEPPQPELELPRRPPAQVGYEIPFPFDVRELEAKYGAGFWRPIVRNYFFRETDLITGPPDPEDFYDEFLIECEHPETGYRWWTGFYVATPKGLARVMAEGRTDFLYGDSTIIVRRFDLKTIVRAVMESFAEWGDPNRQTDWRKSQPASEAE